MRKYFASTIFVRTYFIGLHVSVGGKKFLENLLTVWVSSRVAGGVACGGGGLSMTSCMSKYMDMAVICLILSIVADYWGNCGGLSLPPPQKSMPPCQTQRWFSCCRCTGL